MGHGSYWDEDVARESREFFRALDQEDRELPSVSPELDERDLDKPRPLGRLSGRKIGSTYQ